MQSPRQDIKRTFLGGIIMSNQNFDERQKLIRYKIISVAYFILIGYLFIVCELSIFIDIKFASLADIVITGIALSGTFLTVMMIFKDCYLGRFESKKLITAGMIFFILLIIYNVKTLIEKDGIISNGKLNDNYIMFCVSFMWGIISISFFIKEILNRKKAKTSKEE